MCTSHCRCNAVVLQVSTPPPPRQMVRYTSNPLQCLLITISIRLIANGPAPILYPTHMRTHTPTAPSPILVHAWIQGLRFKSRPGPA